MRQSELDKVQQGDTLRNVHSGQSCSIADVVSAGDRRIPIGIRSFQITNPDEWELVRVVTKPPRGQWSSAVHGKECPQGDCPGVPFPQAKCIGCLALEAVTERLLIALHDTIRWPMGVIPPSAEEFYSQAMADAAEQQ